MQVIYVEQITESEVVRLMIDKLSHHTMHGKQMFWCVSAIYPSTQTDYESSKYKNLSGNSTFARLHTLGAPPVAMQTFS